MAMIILSRLSSLSIYNKINYLTLKTINESESTYYLTYNCVFIDLYMSKVQSYMLEAQSYISEVQLYM